MRAGILLGLFSTALWGGSVAGLKWTDPAGWTNEGSRPMRAATYSVPPASGDSDKSECVVYFFGQGQGGSVESNINRWKSQMTNASGGPADAKVTPKTIHGLRATTIDMSGTYAGMGGPSMAPLPAKAATRFLGAIIEGPAGSVFIKFAGPSKTVSANESKFNALVNSFQQGTQVSASR
jgi:hypothetical protein